MTSIQYSDNSPAKLLFIGVYRFISNNNGSIIANIVSIKVANQKVKHIDMAQLEADNLKFDIKELCLEERNDKYYLDWWIHW